MARIGVRGLPLLRVLILLILTGGSSWADTSNNAKSVTISKTASVLISNLSDIIFPPSAAVPPAQSIAVCVYSNNGGQYRLTAVSANASDSAMRVKSGSAFIVYDAIWTTAGAGAIGLQSGVATPLMNGADQASPSCNGSTNARLQIALDASTYQAAPLGAYVDILSITIAPN